MLLTAHFNEYKFMSVKVVHLIVFGDVVVGKC